MQHTPRTLAAALAGAAFATAFLVYCGEVPGSSADPDAGTSADGGVGSGGRTLTLKLACDKVFEKVESPRTEPVPRPGGTYRAWYAVADVAGLDPTRATATTMLCDRTCEASSTANCGDDLVFKVTSIGVPDNATPPPTTCVSGTAGIGQGRVVVPCGKMTQIDGEQADGHHFQRVVVRLTLD
jgi:hypothetical protein